MNKYFILATAAVIAMCACTKNDVSFPAREISFQAVNSVGQTKALDGTTAFTHDSFGVYAWSEGTQGYFMDNETISEKQDGKWTPSTTYYWPKDSYVRFVSYYPREDAGSYITIAEDEIIYKDVDVAANQVDLMFADKTVYNGYPTGGAAATDVPIIFRHALSQLNIQTRLAYESKVNKNADGTVKDNYRWEVEISGIRLVNISYEGSLDIFNSAPGVNEEGTYTWNMPENRVWEASEKVAAIPCEGEGPIASSRYTTVLSDYFVLPQALKNQAIEFTFNVKTYRGVGEAAPTLFLSEVGVVKTVPFATVTSIPAWRINQATTYVFALAPTAGAGSDPSDPSKPIDPNDPYLQDVEVLFDPAVVGWTSVVGGASVAI